MNPEMLLTKEGKFTVMTARFALYCLQQTAEFKTMPEEKLAEHVAQVMAQFFTERYGKDEDDEDGSLFVKMLAGAVLAVIETERQKKAALSKPVTEEEKRS